MEKRELGGWKLGRGNFSVKLGHGALNDERERDEIGFI